MTLVKSPVLFNEIDHTYTLGNTSLSGVTSILNRQLFKEKYSGIDEDVLNRAAKYGTGVHEAIELYDTLDIGEENVNVQHYIRLMQQHGLTRLENEYLVSDEEYVASSIDIVCDDYSLIDIKTTSHLDEEYVAWQLSFYAYLFELQNPGCQVGKLFALWIPKPRYGKPKMVVVKRKPASEIIRLIEADKNKEQFIPAPTSDNPISIPQDAIDEVIRIEKSIKQLKEMQEIMRNKLLAMMQENDVKSFKAQGLSLTRKLATTKQSLDSKMLQEKYPDIYNECLKTSEVKESILIKV